MTDHTTNCTNDRFVMWALDLGFATGHADTEQELLDEVGAQIKELQAKYYELLYGVGSKFPNETRHETALRYIQNAETHNNRPAKAAEIVETQRQDAEKSAYHCK